MRIQSRIARFSILAVAAFAFVLAPSTAFARDRHHNRHPRHHNWYDSHGYQYGHHSRYGGARVYQYYRADYRQERYYCAPCNHYFDSRPNFHSHLNQRHHIPLWKIPFVIVHSTLGWIFHGSHHY